MLRQEALRKMVPRWSQPWLALKCQSSPSSSVAHMEQETTACAAELIGKILNE